MKGDFTRDTFERTKHFSRVLMQQGRVTLDADHNEQAAIQLRYLRTLARDIIGPFAAPAGADGGFVLSADPNGVFAISKGRYYVDGLLVENDTDNCTYTKQPEFPLPADDALLATFKGADNQSYWVYLDVWERHITPIEDDSIREKALGGPDTCTRAKVVWQVKALPLTEQLRKNLVTAEQKVAAQINDLWTKKAQLEKQFEAAAPADTATQINLLKQIQPLDEQIARLTHLSLLPVVETLLSQLVRISNASLAARVDPGHPVEDACVTPPDSKYRGAENQLYRVEIQRGGKVGEATFKWSRDNGSVATAWIGGSGSDLQVASMRGFAAGNWVELSDDNFDLLGKPGVLLKLAKVEGGTLTVDAATAPPPITDFPNNPKVRRWDQIETDAVTLVDGAMPIQESPAGGDVWIDLEDGVQVKFSTGGDYRSGDYWLIPARVATGKVEWPQADELNPQPFPPQGVEHHHALLGAVTRRREAMLVEGIRCEFWPLFFCTVQANLQVGTRDVINPVFALVKPVGDVVTPVKAPKRKRRRG